MSESMKNHYIVVHIRDVTEKMIDQCAETSYSTLRVSSRGNVILKWSGIKPESVSEYEEVDIFSELRKPEWGTDGIE